MGAPFVFDRRFDFAVSRHELWDVFQETDAYPQWWSWLRQFDADGLQEGSVAHCVIQAPLPYALRFDVTVERVVPSERVETRITGDLDGPARLEISETGTGSEAHLAWSLQLRDPVLRRLAIVGRPLMVWAHDRVVDVGMRDFETRALDGRGSR